MVSALVLYASSYCCTGKRHNLVQNAAILPAADGCPFFHSGRVFANESVASSPFPAMFSLLSVVLFICFLLSHLIRAIEVAPDSDCSGICINDPAADPSSIHPSFTTSSHVLCNDWELYGSNADDKGKKFKSCLECESTSTHSDRSSGENDVYWFLCEPLLSLCGLRKPLQLI